MAKRIKIELPPLGRQPQSAPPMPTELAWLQPGVEAWLASGDGWAHPKHAVIHAHPRFVNGEWHVAFTHDGDMFEYKCAAHKLHPSQAIALRHAAASIRRRVARLSLLADEMESQAQEIDDGKKASG